MLEEDAGSQDSRDGISGLGRSTEQFFRDITGAGKPRKASLGDADFGDERYVEVKKASAGTINQVRALKYITLVVYSPPKDEWFVVPACDVVRLVAGKRRGQHCENPFECAALSTAKLADFKVDPTGLRDATLGAIAKSEAHPDLRDAMHTIHMECRQLADRSINAANDLLT